jgi:hypothetical protein
MLASLKVMYPRNAGQKTEPSCPNYTTTDTDKKGPASSGDKDYYIHGNPDRKQ